MLLKEIGRFGDSIENLKPTDLKKNIPQNLQSGYVGLFWHIGNNKWFIIKASVLDDSRSVVEMGQNYDEKENPGDLQIDFNEFHKDVWNNSIIKKYPEYESFHFDHFSRGRVVYNAQKKSYGIYFPATSNINSGVISFLAAEFQLPSENYEVDTTIYKRKKDMETLCVGRKNEVLYL